MLKLIGIFGLVSFILSNAKNIEIWRHSEYQSDSW